MIYSRKSTIEKKIYGERKKIKKGGGNEVLFRSCSPVLRKRPEKNTGHSVFFDTKRTYIAQKLLDFSV